MGRAIGAEGGRGWQRQYIRDFPYVELFASLYYIHVMKEGPEESLFDPIESPACDRADMQLIHGTEAENQIGRSDKDGNFPVLQSGKIMNPMADDMDILCCIGITIYGDNYPAPANTPEKARSTARERTRRW